MSSIGLTESHVRRYFSEHKLFLVASAVMLLLCVVAAFKSLSSIFSFMVITSIVLLDIREKSLQYQLEEAKERIRELENEVIQHRKR